MTMFWLCNTLGGQIKNLPGIFLTGLPSRLFGGSVLQSNYAIGKDFNNPD
jgi:hypothetical protein